MNAFITFCYHINTAHVVCLNTIKHVQQCTSTQIALQRASIFLSHTASFRENSKMVSNFNRTSDHGYPLSRDGN